jgi:DDE family transposase
MGGRTTRHPGYAVSQRQRKRVEEIFGWIKTVALMAKTHFRGCQRVGWMFTLRAAAYNLVRLSNCHRGKPLVRPVRLEEV